MKHSYSLQLLQERLDELHIEYFDLRVRIGSMEENLKSKRGQIEMIQEAMTCLKKDDKTEEAPNASSPRL